VCNSRDGRTGLCRRGVQLRRMQPRNQSAEDQQEFEAALGALVRAAERADVEVADAHDISATGGGRWEVQISRVAHERDSR